MIRSLTGVLCVVFAVLSCDGNGGVGPAPLESIVVAGAVENRSGEPVPLAARVLAVWIVASASPDRSYIFGEGSFEPRTATAFQLILSAPPPPAAFNSNGVAAGILAVTTNQTVTTGDDLFTIPQSEVIGAAGQHAVIYVDGDPEAIGGWVSQFPRGYSVGQGVDMPGTFDGFEPGDARSIHIVLDDLDNIEFVNWF